MATARTRMHQAHELGQSIWYDNMRRGLLRSGALAGLVEKGVRGLTSNPTIFERAIVASSDYEEALRKLAVEGKSTGDIYEALVIDDIRGACDLLLPVYQESDGVDGRVSLEVLPELATNTEKTVSEGLRLAKLVGRPNVMIKVPATPEGIPAIRALTAQGVSVNVTLIFSLLQYREVLEAYLAGLEDRKAKGGSFKGLASVASFFVSRVDTVCDKLLNDKAAASPSEAARCQVLRGKVGIANAKLAYEIYGKAIASPRWKALATAGANPQRLLWASTGTKDPSYPDTYYVDALMGRDTVDTVPPATLDAFIDHGNPDARLETGIEEARSAVAELGALGIDLSRVCHGLLVDGVKSFTTSMTTLTDAIAARRAAILEAASGRQKATLPEALRLATDAEIARLAGEKALERIWKSDPTVFSKDPAHEKSIKSRLGWLREPASMQSNVEKLRELEAFAAEVAGAGFTDAVLLGMGGSSLCPEVLGLTWPSQPGALKLHVLDNTDPAAVAEVDRAIAGKKALFIVASKSGGTIEIQSFERHFWQKTLEQNNGDVAKTGAAFVAITDPATRLGQLAEEKKYRKTFVNAADIGGRYSALSYFGLVPAALLRAPLAGMLETAVTFAAASSAAVPVEESPGVRLGAMLGAACKAGRDKLTFVISPEIASLGSWIEQLVAESTGKEGKGIVPIDGEPLGAPEVYGSDRLFAYLRFGGGDAKQDAAVAALEAAGHPVIRIAVDTREALGRELFRWEMATAVAGATLGVNPFDEPNVTEAKLATGALLTTFGTEGKLPAPDAEAACQVTDLDRIAAHLASAGPGDYLAFCAYFLRTPARDAALARLRVACRDRAKNATTVGYGPRFLHSTGQLHKGGPNTGVFIQLTSDATADLPIPGESYSFATLRNAQSLGDLQVLRRRGRRALRVQLGADADAGLKALAEAMASRRK
ncbi:MAG TPA: bifunctional transaldolase/phosoglucose isomerase [Polyangia bacterium]|nr:bifunctional transaldolase/phosoglucose isomerase [Polyangia bacterium]